MGVCRDDLLTTLLLLEQLFVRTFAAAHFKVNVNWNIWKFENLFHSSPSRSLQQFKIKTKTYVFDDVYVQGRVVSESAQIHTYGIG